MENAERKRGGQPSVLLTTYPVYIPGEIVKALYVLTLCGWLGLYGLFSQCVLSRKDMCRSAAFMQRRSPQGFLLLALAVMAAGIEMQPASACTERCQLTKTPSDLGWISGRTCLFL